MKPITTTGGHTAELKVLTVREWRALQAEVAELNKTYGEGSEQAGTSFMDASIKAVVTKLDDVSENVLERSLELPLEDYLELWNAVQTVIVPKALTSATNTDARKQG